MIPDSPEYWLVFNRVVRFGETDGAGVIHFYNLFRWCHEAWEESLEKYGIYASEIFPNTVQSENYLEVALPVINCKANFRAPITTGDQLKVLLSPEKIDMWSFEIQTKFQKGGEDVAWGLIRHLAINVRTRKRCSLPENITRWLEASSLNHGPRPL